MSLLHRGDEHSRRFGENPRRLEDDVGPGRNAERLDDDIDSDQRALHPGHFERVAGSAFHQASGLLLVVHVSDNVGDVLVAFLLLLD